MVTKIRVKKIICFIPVTELNTKNLCLYSIYTNIYYYTAYKYTVWNLGNTSFGNIYIYIYNILFSYSYNRSHCSSIDTAVAVVFWNIIGPCCPLSVPALLFILV